MKQFGPVAEYLKQKRLESDLTQRQVSEKLGYETPQFISNWERGISLPPFHVLKKLCEIYKMPKDSFQHEILNAVMSSYANSIRHKLKDAFR